MALLERREEAFEGVEQASERWKEVMRSFRNHVAHACLAACGGCRDIEADMKVNDM